MAYSVLAVDQSMTSTGFAHYREGDPAPTWGVFSLPTWEDREGEMLWQWFEWLGKKVSDLGVTNLYLEQTFNPHSHHEALHMKIAQYGQIAMADVVRHLCVTKRGHPLVFELVPVQSWRAEWIGAEQAPKGLVQHQKRKWLKDKSVEAAAKRGWLVDSNDAADALGILSYCIGAIDPAWRVRQGPLFRRAEMACEEERRSQ